MLENILYWFQIISAGIIIILVLLQPSKGSDLGTMAGGSSSGGNKAYVDPVTKITGGILLSFIALSFSVTYVENQNKKSSVFESINLSEELNKAKSEVSITDILNEKGDNNE